MLSEAFRTYAQRINEILYSFDPAPIKELAEALLESWEDGTQVFLCGNGGSAANSIHLANDYIYGIAKEGGIGLKAHALSSNPSILTCIANDVNYESIFSSQLEAYAEACDLLIVLSGSGNSPNVIKAIEKAHDIGMHTAAIVGFDGGACKQMVDIPIHFPIDDMQIAEDLQMIVGHMLMQWLQQHNPLIQEPHYA